VVRRGQELVVHHRRGDVEGEIAADCVVNSSGRVAQVEGLDLAVGDVAHRDLRIDIDPFLRSKTNPDVLVAGDALDGIPQLSALATHMGHLAAHNLFSREPRALDLSAVPSVVFTVPNLASVGLTAERAKLAGRDVVVHDNDMHSWRSARSYAEDVAFARVLVDAKTEKIVGAHLLGHGAAETIHTFAAAIARGADARELAETVYAYPTFHSDIPYLVGRG
jgi:glutathione reductase (NADPH)